MCGILGHVNHIIDEDKFSSALNNLKHRGPDNQSIVKLDKLILGHTRLSIIDLDNRSNQPFQLGDFIIVFNGEIYNYIELKEELIRRGKTFKTNSDTEVLLVAYDFWGKDFLSKLNGMWAFAIYDRIKQEIFFSRDRYGVKPLYFYRNGQEFVFGSEIKAILPFKEKNEVIKDEIIRYLVYGVQEHRKETLFRDVERFPKGSYGVLCLKTNKFSINHFYKINYDKIKFKNPNDAIYSIKTILNDSVRLRLRSDVKLGMALSGGVDSNIIVLIANRINKKIKSFTATYPNSNNHNEDSLTNKTVLKLGLNHFYKKVEIQNYIEKLEYLIWCHDEPFDTMGIIAQFSVYEKMKEENIKVSLDGQGADEVFGGYKTYRVSMLKANFFKIKFLKYYFKSNLSQIFSDTKILLASFFPSFFERLYFYKRADKLFKGQVSFVKSFKKMFYHPSNLNIKLNNDVNEYLPVLLKYVDRNSMANSIEGRGPFLDFNLVDFGFSISQDLKYKEGFSKYLLRAAYNGEIADQILWNKVKKGFPVPYEQWLKDETFKKKINSYFNNSKLLKQLNINTDINPQDALYWKIINLAIWEKQFNVELE
jgi:asparagine synthase (glutamine-hydrolysing)